MRPTLYRRSPSGFPEEAIGICLRMVELAIRHGSRNETLAAVDKFFDAQEEEREEVTPDSSIQEIGLPNRMASILESAGLPTIGAVCECTAKQLLEKQSVGQDLLRHLHKALAAHGFRLRRVKKKKSVPAWAMQLKEGA